MKINKSFLRIALAAGLVGLAACGGSDSSSNRERNAAIATNVKQYSGQITYGSDRSRRSERTNSAVQTSDKFSFSFEENLDAVDSNSSVPTFEKIKTCAVSPDWVYTVCPEVIPREDENHREYSVEVSSLQNDFRSVFTNFELSSAINNGGTLDLKNTKWANCPLIATFGTSTNNEIPTTTNSFTLVFAEAPNVEIATSDCNAIPVNTPENERKVNFYSADGKATPATGLRLELRFGIKDGVFPSSAQPNFSDVLAKGLQEIVSNSARATLLGEKLELRRRSRENWTLNRLTSAKVLDYAPYAATATVETGVIKVSWTQSADLDSNSEVSYVVETSTDGFKDSENTNSIDVGRNLTFSQANCEVNPTNDIAAGTEFSYRVFAISPDGVASEKTQIVSVKKTTENVLCPEGSLSAPTNIQATFIPSDEGFSVSWDSPSDAGESDLMYCVLASGDNFSTEFTETNCFEPEKSARLEVVVPFYFASSTFKVYASRLENGVTSAMSESSSEVRVPAVAPVTDVKASLLSDGLKVSWTPGVQAAGFKVQSVELAWGFVTSTGRGPMVNGGGTTSSIFVIPNSDLSDGFGPGAKVWIDVASSSNLGLSEVASGSFEYPIDPQSASSGTEETAKAAIVTSTATEVQLPAMDLNFAINLADVYTGFGVKASDVKSVEYQVADGSWVPLTKDESIKIPKTASKLSVRVTKTNGEKVVSEKAIERTEVTTDTTMAPTDSSAAPVDTAAPVVTEAPVTTEAPESSDSSSSNNILLYILGLIVLAGAAGFFIKKKSASTK
jgi:hypothetical protein